MGDLQLHHTSQYLKKITVDEGFPTSQWYAVAMTHNNFLCRLQEDKMVSDLNLEIQFLLKQGQVEIGMGKFIPNFSDSVLVHRSRIEELNSQIKVIWCGIITSIIIILIFVTRYLVKGNCMLWLSARISRREFVCWNGKVVIITDLE